MAPGGAGAIAAPSAYRYQYLTPRWWERVSRKWALSGWGPLSGSGSGPKPEALHQANATTLPVSECQLRGRRDHQHHARLHL